jgi:hypothetical protein
MVVSDLEDMFVPLHKGFLVDPVQSRSVQSVLPCLVAVQRTQRICFYRNQIEKVLELIPKMYADTPCTEVALGALVKGVLSGLVRSPAQICDIGSC